MGKLQHHQYQPPQGPPPQGYYQQGPPQGYNQQGPPQGYHQQGPPQGYHQPPQGNIALVIAGAGWRDLQVYDATDPSRALVYFLDYPRSFTGWNFNLLRGGKGGPLAVHIKKGGFSSDINLETPFGNVQFLKTGVFSAKREFISPTNGQRYAWKTAGMFSSNMDLIHSDSKRMVASWDHKAFSFSKKGTLTLTPEAQSFMDICVATAICVDKTEQERRNAAASSSTAAVA